MPKKKYSKEFKERAVHLAEKKGNTTKGVAQDLGINENMLGRWKRELRENKYDPFSGSGNKQYKSAEEEENERLRRELAEVKEERDILKKATRIFSQNQK